MKLSYRAGTADELDLPRTWSVPGQEESQPFLAQSGFASSAEPYYGYEHWYGEVTIHGAKHHLLIFPRAYPAVRRSCWWMSTPSGNLQLDHNGTIIIEN